MVKRQRSFNAKVINATDWAHWHGMILVDILTDIKNKMEVMTSLKNKMAAIKVQIAQRAPIKLKFTWNDPCDMYFDRGQRSHNGH